MNTIDVLVAFCNMHNRFYSNFLSFFSNDAELACFLVASLLVSDLFTTQTRELSPVLASKGETLLDPIAYRNKSIKDDIRKTSYQNLVYL